MDTHFKTFRIQIIWTWLFWKSLSKLFCGGKSNDKDASKKELFIAKSRELYILYFSFRMICQQFLLLWVYRVYASHARVVHCFDSNLMYSFKILVNLFLFLMKSNFLTSVLIDLKVSEAIKWVSGWLLICMNKQPSLTVWATFIYSEKIN